MKILTKEEEQAHYNATLKGGITGGTVGLILVGISRIFIRNSRRFIHPELPLPL
jgi:hypothetical protein